MTCGKLMRGGVCQLLRQHGGECARRRLIAGSPSWGLSIWRYSAGSFTVEHCGELYDFRIIGSYSDEGSAIAGMARLKAEGFTR